MTDLTRFDNALADQRGIVEDLKPRMHLITPDHRDAILVGQVCDAMRIKLAKARAKGRTGWHLDDWMEQCRRELIVHIAKGDPIDIILFAAFLWWHGESTWSEVARSTLAVEALHPLPPYELHP